MSASSSWKLIVDLFAGRIRPECLLIIVGYVLLYLLAVRAWRWYANRQGPKPAEGIRKA